MATWTDDIITALTRLGGIGALRDIYEEVRKLRPPPHPKSIQATIRGAIERNSSDSKAHTGSNDLFYSVDGLGGGIWGLRDYQPKTKLANDIDISSAGNDSPGRKLIEVYRIIRDTALARHLKNLHHNKCQICSLTLKLGNQTYSEAHHIIPMGAPHHGEDTPGNVIVVCPNCHVKLDYFSIKLDPKKISSIQNHAISEGSLAYHNEMFSMRLNEDAEK